MKTRLNVSLSRSRWALVSLFALVGGLACGVVEHPHDTQTAGTGDDFGPSSGAGAATTTGGASVGGAMTAASGSGGGGSSGTGDAGSGGGPAPSGVTINLGGVDVPKERAIAFIHIGHSNMAGRATRPQSSRPYHFTETHPHAFMYHPGSAPELAIEPKTAGDTAAGGPGTALVKEAAMLAPDNYFISLGFGWPSAYCSQFVPGGLYYDQLIAAPKAIKGRVTFGGIFIYLGITERHGTAADRTGFPDCINTLVTAIRNDVGEPTLPALMNDYEVESSGEFVVGGAVANAIRPEIERCPSVVSNFALVSAEGVGMQDDHHFNLDGHRTWVQRALETMKDKGWRPWAP
ncbi:MAG: hypothetical protein K0R70_832 [Steroidobacteraceae bacterium]|nr:hypothetical protein [Steroidobacteraceae bacterium]